MSVLFAMPVPTPLYTVSILLTSFFAVLLLRRCWSFQKIWHYFLTTLFVIVLIAFHFVWLWLDNPQYGTPQLCDSGLLVILIGCMGALLGIFPKFIEYMKSRRSVDND